MQKNSRARIQTVLHPAKPARVHQDTKIFHERWREKSKVENLASMYNI